MKKQSTPNIYSSNQRGVTLIELMVGIVIGLLTVAVAMGALMISRGISGSVSDISQIQQQAAHAFRIVGQQIRQAGSLRLNLAAQKSDGAIIDMADPVAFETAAGDFNPASNTINGKDSPTSSEYKISLGYRNYKEPVYDLAKDDFTQSLLRDCLGQQPSETLIQSRFKLSGSELVCAGASGSAQPIIQNVANFQIRYLLQVDPSPFGNPQISYINATGVGTNWSRVVGVEVCIVLYGNEATDMPSGSSYVDCDGTTSVDMTTLASPRTRRAHMAFRNIYQLRSQGLTSVS